MRADDLLNELSYKQNIGAMETYKFYSVATPEQKYELKRLIAEKNFKEAWRLIKQVTGLELQDLGTESTITDYERAVMEGGHSIEEPARRSALREAVVSELTGWKQSQPQSVIQKRSIKIPSNLTKDKDTRSELQKRKDSGNKNWFRIKEDSENYGGIQLSLEIEKDDEYVDDEDTDNQTIYVTATSNGRELGHVLFTIDYDSHGMVLNPQDLEVDERFRGQGIAATMYDYVKSKGYRIRRSGQQTDAGAAFWAKHKPGKNIWEQGVAEARSSGYKEIEFICVNPRFPDATDPELQKQMYIGLKKIPNVIPLLQDWDEYSEGQKSLSAIYKDRESRQKILALAKQLGVEIDLEQPVSDDYVDRAIRSEHEGQQGVAEEELEEDWKSTAASLAAAAGIAGAGYGGMAAKQSVGNYFKEPTAATQQVKAPTPKIDTTKLQVKKQEQPQVKQPEVKPQVKKSQDVKPITSNPLESKLLAIAKQSGLAGAELAAFMAQCAHETLDFKRMVEFGGKLDFKKYDPKHAPKKAKALGNKHAGDGERYKGRGFIQITGRYNYKKAGEELGLPLEQKPQLVEDPEIAAKVAVWFWKHRVQPNVDNFHDVVDVTKYINPAMRGLKDRKENFKEYMSAAQQQGRSV